MHSLAAAVKLTCVHSLVLEKGSVRQGHQCVRKMVMQALASDREGRLQSRLVGVVEGAAHLLGPLEPGTWVVLKIRGNREKRRIESTRGSRGRGRARTD